jgi:hypothetical protein
MRIRIHNPAGRYRYRPKLLQGRKIEELYVLKSSLEAWRLLLELECPSLRSKKKQDRNNVVFQKFFYFISVHSFLKFGLFT